MTPGAKRVAVTGVGVVSPLAVGAAASFRELCAGRRAIREVELFDTSAYRSRLAAEVRALRVSDVAPAGQADGWSRTDAMALVAAREALSSAGLQAARADALLGVAVGGTTGGMFEAERLLGMLDPSEARLVSSASGFLSYPLSRTVDRIVEQLGAGGPRATLCSACSSSATSISTAAQWVARGRVERALAGGADGLCRLTFAGFNALGAMDAEPCRPFDRARKGMNLGEGAAFLLLESEASVRRRGARVLAWLSGWALGAEAHHITLPEPTGERAAALIHEALARAGLGPGAVDYINAHGTGTVPNDATEAKAIGAVLGAATERAFVSSSKGQIGHTLGASGALEAAFTVMAISEHTVPPTAGLSDPEAPLRHVMATGEHADVRVALSTSFGFGGAGTVLLFEADGSREDAGDAPVDPIVVTTAASVGPLGVVEHADHARYLQGPGGQASGRAPEVLGELEPRRSRRFDRATSFATVSAERILSNARVDRSRTGIVVGTAYGNVQRALAFTRVLEQAGPGRVPPAEFPHLLPSSPAGNASIYSRLGGPAASLCHLGASGEAAVHAAVDWLSASATSAVIAGAVEVEDPVVARVLAPLHHDAAAHPRREGACFVLLETAARAHERGEQPLARVDRYGQWVPGATEVALGPPSPAACVVRSVELARAEPFLGAVGWREVPHIDVRPAAGAHEAAGAFALAAAAGRIGSGEVQQALVIGAADDVLFYTLLVGTAP